MSPDDTELHDAVLDRVEFDAAAKRVEVDLRLYRNLSDSVRVAARVVFYGVESFSINADTVALSDNESAGNISYWHPSVGRRSFIYLSDGYLAVTADRVEVVVDEPAEA